MRFKQIIDYPFGKIVWGRSKAAIQAACDAAADGSRLLLFGEYDFSAAGEPLTITKNLELTGFFCSFNGGSTRSDLVKIYGITKGLTFRGIKFTSTASGAGYGLVYCNEQGNINNLLFDSCEWTGPNGRFNGFGMNAWNVQGGYGVTFTNITLRNCWLHDLGRMGGEFLAHKNDGVPRITNVNIENCRVERVGLYNVSGDDDVHGMGWSFSGDVVGLTMTSPVVTDSLLGIELICTRQFTISNPRIVGSRSSTTSKNVTNGCLGISLTDGGNADNGNPGRYPRDGVITGGFISVSGRALNARFCYGTTFNGGRWVSGEYLQIQHGQGVSLKGVDVESSAAKFIALFENHKETNVEGGRWSRKPAEAANVSPLYEPVSFDGNCTGKVTGLEVYTNGSPNNYYAGQPYNLNYLFANTPNVAWSNLWWNGKRMADSTVLKSHYVEVTTSSFDANNQTNVSATAGYFKKLPFPTVTSDVEKLWDAANFWYVAPEAGQYVVTTVLRPRDGLGASKRYGQGASLTNGDGPTFLWTQTNAVSSGCYNQRIMTLAAGDKVFMIYSLDSFDSYLQAYMTVFRLPY